MPVGKGSCPGSVRNDSGVVRIDCDQHKAMDTDTGKILILWTVRCSVALYVVALWRYLQATRSSPSKADSAVYGEWRTDASDRDERAVMTGGKPSTVARLSLDPVYRMAWLSSWIFCLIHVVCAYHFQHQWSQTAAIIHTAEMTERVVGLYWSGGLYINYLFLTVWGIDCVRLFRQKPGLHPATMHAVAAFMMFNATVVFGPRWWVIPVGGLLAALLIQRFAERR